MHVQHKESFLLLPDQASCRTVTGSSREPVLLRYDTAKANEHSWQECAVRTLRSTLGVDLDLGANINSW